MARLIPPTFPLGADVSMVSPADTVTLGTITRLTATQATVTFQTPRGVLYRKFVVPSDHPNQDVRLTQYAPSHRDRGTTLVLATHPQVTQPGSTR